MVSRRDSLVIMPTGLRRVDAAKHCGVSTGYFDRMVAEGLLPQPRLFGDGVKLWIRQELDDALYALPTEDGGNSCDHLFA